MLHRCVSHQYTGVCPVGTQVCALEHRIISEKYCNMSPAMRREFCQNRSDRECHGKGMHIARQISRRLGRTAGARARSAADYSISATLSVVSGPLKLRGAAPCAARGVRGDSPAFRGAGLSGSAQRRGWALRRQPPGGGRGASLGCRAGLPCGSPSQAGRVACGTVRADCPSQLASSRLEPLGCPRFGQAGSHRHPRGGFQMTDRITATVSQGSDPLKPSKTTMEVL